MTYLIWNLTTEDDPVGSLYDPVGQMKILGDKGIIIENCTNLDAFLEAFIKGIEGLKFKKTITVDPLIEPDDIIFSYQDNVLEIQYGKQEATIFNKLQFVEEVKNAVREIIDILDELALTEKKAKRKLTRLRNFLDEDSLTTLFAVSIDSAIATILFDVTQFVL